MALMLEYSFRRSAGIYEHVFLNVGLHCYYTASEGLFFNKPSFHFIKYKSSNRNLRT